MANIADALEATRKAKVERDSEWIKIEDLVPPAYVTVWVYEADRNRVQAATNNGYGTWWGIINRGHLEQPPTHWRPFDQPEPPQEA